MLERSTPDPFVTRETLLLRLQADGQARNVAWQEFHEKYAPIIGGFARRMGAPRQDVPDLVQDVLLGFFAASPEFVYDPAKGRFRGYLKTCTWRAFQKRMGSRVRWGDRPLDQVDPEELKVEEVWNDVWESQRLWQAVARVRSRYMADPVKGRTFQAFEMSVFLERPGKEVAAQLDMSLDSVHQARRRISQALKAELDEMRASDD